METTKKNASSPCGDSKVDGPANADKSVVQNGPADITAKGTATDADVLYQNGLDDDEADDDLEDAFNAVGSVVEDGVDQEQSENWETEINSPCYVVPPKAYMYGKEAFVPSDEHAVSVMRRTPWLHTVEGQFDDADES